MRTLPTFVFPLSIAVGVMVAIAAALGLFAQATYANEATSFATQGRAQDLVTLFWVVPVFGAALYYDRKGMFVARVAWLGVLLYFAYTYLMASVGLAYNFLFLLYVTIYGTSLALLVVGLWCIRSEDIAWRFSYRFPRTGTAVFSIAIGGMVALLWLADIVRSLATGTPPPQLSEAVTQSLVVQAMDLGIIVPLCITGGVLLRRGAPLGYVLSGMVIVKALTLGPAMVSMAAFLVAGGMQVPVPVWMFALLVTGGGAYFAYRYIKSLI